MNELTSGAVAGLAGTAVMSAAMAADRAFGWMRGEVPPRKVARRFEESLGVRDDLSRPAFEASWVAQHFAYGAAAGVAYEMIRRRLRPREPLSAGAMYGAALWAVSYAGWLPLAGLYPPPHEDNRERALMIALHHLIYGATVAVVADRLAPDPARGPATHRIA